jgi:hypothetical protein
MKKIDRKRFFIFALLLLALSPAAHAEQKKTSPSAKTQATAAPMAAQTRDPGYAILALENGNQDEVRASEGESLATLPNIVANDGDYLTVMGAHTVVTVYADPNFRGHSLTLRCGHYEFLERPRNDIESIRVSVAKAPVKNCQGSESSRVQYKTWGR